MIRSFKDIYIRFLYGKSDPETFRELKRTLNQLSDHELTTEMEAEWNSAGVFPSMDKRTKALIKSNLAFTLSYTSKRNTRWLRMAVAAVALVVLSVSVWFITTKQAAEFHPLLVEVASGDKALLTLPDGSKVRLNCESHLSLDLNYGKGSRQVTLSGEGYFDVLKDADKPFVVHTNHLDVEVLGTSFNVYTYEKEHVIETSLVAGSIKVSTNTVPVQTVYLNPNEKALFDKQSGHLIVEKTDNRFETAWLRGDLVFRSTRIKEVMQKLERWYGVTIHLTDSGIENDLFTGSFDNEHIIDVIKILQKHYAFRYKITGEDVYITFDPK